jgi:diacylglycerol kinase family enzyme
MATGGFGSQVTANTSEDLKKVLGGAAYLFTGLSRFSELHAAYGELQGPDFHWRGELLALGIGNGRQAGGGHVLCPQALADDGLLDISILPAPQELVGTLKTLLSDGFGIDNMFVGPACHGSKSRSPKGFTSILMASRWRATSMRFEARPGALKCAFAGHSPLLGSVPTAQSSRLMICSRTANSTRPATS